VIGAVDQVHGVGQVARHDHLAVTVPQREALLVPRVAGAYVDPVPEVADLDDRPRALVGAAHGVADVHRTPGRHFAPDFTQLRHLGSTMPRLR